MFKNIGAKTKGLAKVLFYIMSIVCILVGIFFIIYGAADTAITSEQKIATLIMGLAIAIGGVFVSWLETFILYGFGELIDTNQKILKHLEKKEK